MAPRFRFARRFIRKRSVFRRKRRYYRKSRRGTTDGVRNFKLRVHVPDISNLVTGNSFTDNPSSSPDWSSCAGLFSHYRVKAMKIRYIPTFNVNAVGATDSLTPIYLTHIADAGSPSAPSVTQLIQYENTKVLSRTRTFSYYRRMKKMLPLNQSTQNVENGGWFRTAVPSATQRLYLLSGAPNSPNSIGQAVVTYYCQFINRN